jgi:hypothetical protein
MAGAESAERPKPVNVTLYEISSSFLAVAQHKPIEQILVGDYTADQIAYWRERVYNTIFNYTQRDIILTDVWQATLPKKTPQTEQQYTPAHIRAVYAMIRHNYLESNILRKRMARQGISSVEQLAAAETLLHIYKGEGIKSSEETMLPPGIYHPEP